MLRSIAIGTALVLALIVMGLAIWISAPERRLARSAVLAGIVVGRAAAGAVW